MELISDQNIIDVFSSFNPWWVHPGDSPRVPPNQRPYFNSVYESITSTAERAIFLSGMRGVGKTTILYQVVQELIRSGTSPRQILFLKLDEVTLKSTPWERWFGIIEAQFRPPQGPFYLLLDEVHVTPNWAARIKDLIDSKKDYRIVTTSSSSVKGISEIQSAATRRFKRIHIPPLSFFEYLYLFSSEVPPLFFELIGDIGRKSLSSEMNILDKDDLEKLKNPGVPLGRLFQNFLLVGGLPYIASQKPPLKVSEAQRWIATDIQDAIIKDITSGKNDDVGRLFIHLCNHSGLSVDKSSIGKLLDGISRVSVANYLVALSNASLTYNLEVRSTHGTILPKAKEKVYIADASVRNSFIHRDESLFTTSDNEASVVVETTVARHLIDFADVFNWDIGVWRHKNKLEVDFVLHSKDRREVILVESKYSSSPRINNEEEILTLWEREKSKGRNIRALYVLTKGVTAFRNSFEPYPIFYVSVDLFLALVGWLVWNRTPQRDVQSITVGESAAIPFARLDDSGEHGDNQKA
jgi:predicted AAA+ superfamily ATPase